MSQILIRFLVGGTVVSAFAVIGDLLKPKSFAGLFDRSGHRGRSRPANRPGHES
jgi:hypothetical protein